MDAASPSTVSARKREHLEIAGSRAGEGPSAAGWDDVRLLPASLPELALEDVDLTTIFLDREVRAPLIIAGMTGGHPESREINAALAVAAERLGIAIGVGSQRAALADPSLLPTYTVVRERAPSAFVVANVGAAQLVGQEDAEPFSLERLEEAVGMVEAQALAIHLNAVEEMVQPEGDRSLEGVREAIASAAAGLSVPVIAKETGSGMVAATGDALADAGVAALDVGGSGGADFAVVEAVRAERAGDTRGARLGRTFAGWGLSTAASILETRGCGPAVIGTGGIRNGLDAAKALALGADLVGVGRAALAPAQEGPEEAVAELELILEELRVACLLCGVARPAQLRDRGAVLTGATCEWARERGLADGRR
jgi:isopentenyl-diphosphate Delta-isomerase